jgi:inosose dehydratase
MDFCILPHRENTMTNTISMNRRAFVASAGLGALALSSGAIHRAQGETAPAAKDAFRGLKVGLASYSTREFSLDDTLAMMKDLKIQYVTIKDESHLKIESTTTEERKAALQKIKDAGLQTLGTGVVYLKNDEAQARKAFEYCRDLEMPVMVAAPDVDALPLIDKLVKEFNIKLAIHNHGPGDKRYPSPLDAYRISREYDKRIGCCIDIGHAVRIGDNEVDVIYAVKDRLYDFHMKDVTGRSGEDRAIEAGRGVINIPGVLKALLDIGFNGHVALEYEVNGKNPMPGMIESFAYMRGVLAAL